MFKKIFLKEISAEPTVPYGDLVRNKWERKERSVCIGKTKCIGGQKGLVAAEMKMDFINEMANPEWKSHRK